jgi:hypothetical protein
MLIAIPALIIGWAAYAIWMHKVHKEERDVPQESERLSQTKSEISDWAKKMSDFKKPEIKKKPEQNRHDKQ